MKENDIKSNTEMLLKVAERTNEYIHCADKDSADGNREVNCSLESTAWRLSIFQNCDDGAKTDIALASII